MAASFCCCSHHSALCSDHPSGRIFWFLFCFFCCFVGFFFCSCRALFEAGCLLTISHLTKVDITGGCLLAWHTQNDKVHLLEHTACTGLYILVVPPPVTIVQENGRFWVTRALRCCSKHNSANSQWKLQILKRKDSMWPAVQPATACDS